MSTVASDPDDIAMIDPIPPFLGTWIMDPDESEYDQGDPPKSGTYRIEDESGLLIFSMNWIDAEGVSHSESFSGIPNGKPVRLRESGLVDELVLYFEKPTKLVSEARRNGLTIMKATRELSDDGASMTVDQTVHVLDEQTFVNTSIYHRAQ
ncbi:MAG: hypothetical protein ABJN26_19855 [Stappiaceae bacterium]